MSHNDTMKTFHEKLSGIILLLLVFFTSCENFNNGSKIKKEIEDSIAYNNYPFYKIDFDYPESTGVMRSPAGNEISKKLTDSFTLWFDPSTGYEFISWKIIDADTKEEIQNGEYLTLENIDQAQTTCTFTKAPAKNTKFCLIPLIAERPQIIFNSPVSLSTLKDSRIQVLFDHDMDPYSIYYTEAEIDELKKSGVEEKDFLPPISNANQNHYGYKKADEIFFKNILIKNGKTGENINNCFSQPIFENTRTLTIPVKEKNSLKDFTQVFVTIERGFYYTEKTKATDLQKPVQMADKKSWMYQVNNRTDSQPLIIPHVGNKDQFFVKLSDETEIKQIPWLGNISDSFANIKYVKDNKLKLDIQVQEEESGSGPENNFELYATKLFDGAYNDLRVWENNKIISPEYYKNPCKLDYQILTSDAGLFKGIVDLSDLGVDSDGVYNLYCVFYDKSGNRSEYPTATGNTTFYFAVDNTLEMAEPVITDESDSEIKFKISWTPCIDLKETVVRYKKENEEIWSEPFIIGREENYKIFTGLEIATTYDFEITYFDFAGNKKIYNKKQTSDEWVLQIAGQPLKTLYRVGESFNKKGLSVKLKNVLTNEEIEINENLWNVDLDLTKGGINKNGYITYNYKDSIKTTKILTSFNVMEEDALTEEIISIDKWNYKIGDFPQTIAEHQEDSFYTENPVYNDCWYLGADGYFYEKCLENGSDLVREKYSNGSLVLQSDSNSYKYFKVEPIEWTIIWTLKESETIFKFIPKRVLVEKHSYYLNSDERNINGKAIKPNDYKYSTLRAYLNGSYEEDDTQEKTYEGKGFLQKAFTTGALNHILQKPVEFYGLNEEGVTKPLSTNDKIFLLNRNESERLSNITVSDYALAKGHDHEDYCGWTRDSGNDDRVYSFTYESDQEQLELVTEKRSIIPGIFVDIQIELN